MKNALRMLMPPILLEAARRTRAHFQARALSLPDFEYVPEGWGRAQVRRGLKGWDDPSVLSEQLRKWPAFERMIKGTGPMGAHEAHDPAEINVAAHNTLAIFGYVLGLAARKKEAITFLDWGGGLGHYSVIATALFPGLGIDYFCKEEKKLAAKGRALLPGATFYDSDEDFAGRKFDLVMASGSLQYAEDWKALLGRLARATNGYLYVTRLPVIFKSKSYVFLQRARRWGYDTEYLGWCLNREEFLEEARRTGMRLVREFLINESVDIAGAPQPCAFRGYLFTAQGR